MTSKAIAGIFTSETQKHIISALVGERGRGDSFVGNDLDWQVRRSKRNMGKKDVMKLELYELKWDFSKWIFEREWEWQSQGIEC